MPDWFKTQSHKVYTRPREGPGKGWSVKVTAKTRLKRWVRKQRKKAWRKVKRGAKKQWRIAKKDVRRIRRERQRQRAAANRKAARQYQPKPKQHPSSRAPSCLVTHESDRPCLHHWARCAGCRCSSPRTHIRRNSWGLSMGHTPSPRCIPTCHRLGRCRQQARSPLDPSLECLG